MHIWTAGSVWTELAEEKVLSVTSILDKGILSWISIPTFVVKCYGSRIVLLTDITYLPYNGTFAYLSTISMESIERQAERSNVQSKQAGISTIKGDLRAQQMDNFYVLA